MERQTLIEAWGGATCKRGSGEHTGESRIVDQRTSPSLVPGSPIPPDVPGPGGSACEQRLPRATVCQLGSKTLRQGSVERLLDPTLTAFASKPDVRLAPYVDEAPGLCAGASGLIRTSSNAKRARIPRRPQNGGQKTNIRCWPM